MKLISIPLLLALASPLGQAWAAGKAHEHGKARLDVTLEAGQLSLELELPLDSLVGFERAPRNETERKLAAEALARMRDGAALFKPDAAAQCSLQESKVEAPLLEARAGATQGDKGHGDLDASYVFKCAQPAQLLALEQGLFEAFKRLERIEVQMATPRGQGRSLLSKPARSLKLPR